MVIRADLVQYLTGQNPPEAQEALEISGTDPIYLCDRFLQFQTDTQTRPSPSMFHLRKMNTKE